MICNTLVIIIGSTVEPDLPNSFRRDLRCQHLQGVHQGIPKPAWFAPIPSTFKRSHFTQPASWRSGQKDKSQSAVLPLDDIYGWYLWIKLQMVTIGCLSHHSKDLVFDVFNPFRLQTVVLHWKNTGTSGPCFAVRLLCCPHTLCGTMWHKFQ